MKDNDDVELEIRRAVARGEDALRRGDIDTALQAAERAMDLVPGDGSMGMDRHFRLQQLGWVLRDRVISTAAQQRHRPATPALPPEVFTGREGRPPVLVVALAAVVLTAVLVTAAAGGAAGAAGAIWPAVAPYAAAVGVLAVGAVGILVGAWRRVRHAP